MTFRMLAGLVALLGLAFTLGPAILYLASMVEKDQMKGLMLLGTVLWFVAAPFWIIRKPR